VGWGDVQCAQNWSFLDDDDDLVAEQLEEMNLYCEEGSLDPSEFDSDFDSADLEDKWWHHADSSQDPPSDDSNDMDWNPDEEN